MLEKKSKLQNIGTSIMILISPDLYKDSAFPFPLKFSNENGKILEEDFEVNIRVDPAKKRIIIEEVK